MVLLAGCLAGLVAKSSREVAGERYRRARVLLDDLSAVPSDELGQKQYLLVIDALKNVHRASPASSYCDDALLAVGDVYAAMATRYGADPWRRKAVEAYQYVIEQYPHSNLLDKARAGIAELESGRGASLAQARREAEPEEEGEEEEQIAELAPSESAPIRVSPARVSPAEAIVSPVSHLTGAPDDAGKSHAEPAPERMKSGAATISAVRHYTHDGFTRIVIDADDYAPYKFDFLARPSRMYFDLFSTKLDDAIRLGVEIEVNDTRIKRIRAAQNRSTKTRVVLDLTTDVFYEIAWIADPPRLVIDLREQKPGATPPMTLTKAAAPAAPAARDPEPEPVRTQAVAKLEPQPQEPDSFEDAFRALTKGGAPKRTAPARTPEPAPAAEPESEPALAAGALEAKPEPEVHLAKATQPSPADLAPPKPAEATSRGNQSLIRALGLKIGRVVIDAGHGGHDPGNIGPTGLQEKDVVLDVALRLGKLIESKLGAEVLYTRKDDSFPELKARPKMANDAGADLFISVHANAYSSSSVRGIETFYLNFTADPWALKVASRENAASNHSVHELQDLLGKIALKEKIDESREFALKMQGALYGGLSKETSGLRNRGVRQAPLIVLIGAKMPAILAEIGFLSNPTDEKLFKSSAYRAKVAEKLFDGIEAYVNSLSSHSLTMTEKGSASASLD
ncbi:MAG: N-acetylmuramoyl-L-alanine amidase [Bryobacterales bacterium]|nr:N-acetylmuramoyl-L-alanine amidase [Acidobacteriota bacterium]MCB9383053.1 N-acetylmuramoyl-L-alanine amidase [Bryobacterales bacterium]